MTTASERVAAIATAYATSEPALELGSVVLGGQAHPEAVVRIPLSMMNRHGLIAGATGTGKTKTLQLLAEQLSAAGVPVLLADIKGDVSGIAEPGTPSARQQARAADTGDDWQPTAFPVEFLALGGKGTGVPVRASITSFGPVLLSKVMGLNETQESCLNLVFHFADQRGLLLLDLADLRAVIQHLISDQGKDDLRELGALSKATAGVLLRELIELDTAGADVFFGEPEFDSLDLLRYAPDGRGLVSVLELPGVQEQPRLFSTFLMWLVADLFGDLPEIGDVDKPKLVVFLDEAHLIFDEASKDFLDAVERTVRLIRSKGVGLFFVTQTPTDVPVSVLAQLGNRVQHALRAFTPKDADALKETVSTWPRSSAYDLEELFGTLGIGEAAVTVLSANGVPTPVAHTRLRTPRSAMAPMNPDAMAALVAASPLNEAYATPVDRESAYETLRGSVAIEPLGSQATAPARAASPPVPQPAPGGPYRRWDGPAVDPLDALTLPPQPRRTAEAAPAAPAPARAKPPRPRPAASSSAAVFAKEAGVLMGREIARSIFGNSRRRRRR